VSFPYPESTWMGSRVCGVKEVIVFIETISDGLDRGCLFSQFH
jgi:hypothetical protein